MVGWTVGGGAPRKTEPGTKFLRKNNHGKAATMKITVDQATVSSGSLHLGCVVTGPEGSWVRFIQAEVPLRLLPLELATLLVQEWVMDSDVERENEEPLFDIDDKAL